MSNPSGALRALIDALERRRCLFWTGNVLVELDQDYVPAGPITMVLDDEDFATLRNLQCSTAAEETRRQLQVTSLTTEVKKCRVYWGSHGCSRPRGHEGPCLCLSCRDVNEDGWVGAPPYYGPETRFYGEDAKTRGLPSI